MKISTIPPNGSVANLLSMLSRRWPNPHGRSWLLLAVKPSLRIFLELGAKCLATKDLQNQQVVSAKAVSLLLDQYIFIYVYLFKFFTTIYIFIYMNIFISISPIRANCKTLQPINGTRVSQPQEPVDGCPQECCNVVFIS